MKNTNSTSYMVPGQKWKCLALTLPWDGNEDKDDDDDDDDEDDHGDDDDFQEKRVEVK